MQKLVLKHYNKVKPINCTIISGDINKLFTVKLNDNESTGAEIIKGDPILIGVLNDDENLRMIGGNVVGATPQDEKYIICFNEVINIPKELDKRGYDRYPVSLLGDIKVMDTNKRDTACIKDISYSGMCIYSTGDFSINDIVEVTIYLSSNVSKFDGTIMRKATVYGRNEYGIQIIHRDKNSMEATKNLLFSLIQSEKELMYRHLLSAVFKI